MDLRLRITAGAATLASLPIDLFAIGDPRDLRSVLAEMGGSFAVGVLGSGATRQ
jgi:hypothetical protein